MDVAKYMQTQATRLNLLEPWEYAFLDTVRSTFEKKYGRILTWEWREIGTRPDTEATSIFLSTFKVKLSLENDQLCKNLDVEFRYFENTSFISIVSFDGLSIYSHHKSLKYDMEDYAIVAEDDTDRLIGAYLEGVEKEILVR